MQTTDDMAFLLYNNGDVMRVADTYFYNRRAFFVVEIAESVWEKKGMLQWAYSDRIIITPTANLKPIIVGEDETRFLRYQDLVTISYGVQQSVLRSLRRFVQQWQNA